VPINMTKLFVFACVSLLAVACTSTVTNAGDEHPTEADAERLYLAPGICAANGRCEPNQFAIDYPNDGEAECEAQLNRVLGTRGGNSACSTSQLKQCAADLAARPCIPAPKGRKDSTQADAILPSCSGC
jgi:hypothetical protein